MENGEAGWSIVVMVDATEKVKPAFAAAYYSVRISALKNLVFPNHFVSWLMV